jgi:hypothetical protein
VARLRWSLILFLLSATVCVSVVAPIDDPESAFNETDLPVILTRPVAPGTKFVAPADDPAIRQRPLYWVGQGIGNSVLELGPVSKRGYSHRLQNLLCTFLI